MWNPFGWIKNRIRRAIILRTVRKFMDRLSKQEEGMAFLKALFSSKKAGAMILGVLVLVMTQLLGLDEETAHKVAEVIMVYILGQGAADLGSYLKK